MLQVLPPRVPNGDSAIGPGALATHDKDGVPDLSTSGHFQSAPRF